MMRFLKHLWILCGLPVIGCGVPAGPAGPPLETVENVDVARYMGRWYEIASYPAPFQAGCTGTTADYRLRDDGRVEVVNRCRQDALDGPERRATGVARVVDPETNARLKVSFFWPFEGDYWIIDLDEEYRWAVVSEPGRRFLWILSREPVMADATFEAIIGRLEAKEFDPQRLERTLQQPTADH